MTSWHVRPRTRTHTQRGTEVVRAIVVHGPLDVLRVLRRPEWRQPIWPDAETKTKAIQCCDGLGEHGRRQPPRRWLAVTRE